MGKVGKRAVGIHREGSDTRDERGKERRKR